MLRNELVSKKIIQLLKKETLALRLAKERMGVLKPLGKQTVKR